MSPFVDELSPDPAATWWDIFNESRDLPMEPQIYGWTCSICSTDHTLRMTGLDPYSSREKVAGEIGYPSCVDQYSGLKDISCVVRVFESFGVQAAQEWVDWDRAYEICSSTAGIINSVGLYHFFSIRGVQGDLLWVGNSAQGYGGIYETVSRAQFNALPPWQVCYLVR